MKVGVGDRIKELRERMGLNQTELAKKVGISKSVMSRIESGRRPVEDSLMIIFSEKLDTSADYLLGIKIKNDNQKLTMDEIDEAFVEEYINLDEKNKIKFRKLVQLIKEE